MKTAPDCSPRPPLSKSSDWTNRFGARWTCVTSPQNAANLTPGSRDCTGGLILTPQRPAHCRQRCCTIQHAITSGGVS